MRQIDDAKIDAFFDAVGKRLKDGWWGSAEAEKRLEAEKALITEPMKAVTIRLIDPDTLQEILQGDDSGVAAAIKTIQMAALLMFQAGLEQGRLEAISLEIKAPTDPPEITEMMLCESQHLHLRPEQIYRFHVAEDCDECRGLAAVYKDQKEKKQ